MPIGNPRITGHAFLAGLYKDGYFPDQVVDRGREILVRLCERIEADRPADLPALEAEFEAAGSEIETVARGVSARRCTPWW